MRPEQTIPYVLGHEPLVATLKAYADPAPVAVVRRAPPPIHRLPLDWERCGDNKEGIINPILFESRRTLLI